MSKKFATVVAAIAIGALSPTLAKAEGFNLFNALFEPQGRAAPQAAPGEVAAPVAGTSSTREIVQAPAGAAPGSIIVDTRLKYIYFVQDDGSAVRYAVGVARPGFEWTGKMTISRKAEWPAWIPPADMLKRRPELPKRMAGGPDNPLGARAMYLYEGRRDSGWRIHGTNEASTIGQAVSSGCIRMLNTDIIDLYKRVKLGTRVTVI